MARKKLSVEQVLSVLDDIPEDKSERGNEETLDIESENDEFILVTSSSESEDDDIQETLTLTLTLTLFRLTLILFPQIN